MSRTPLFSSALALLVMAGCHEPITQPEASPDVSAMGSAAMNAAAATLSPSFSVDAELLDELAIRDAVVDAINPGDYACTSPALIGSANDAIQAIIDDPFELALAQQLIGLGALDLVDNYALFIREESRNVDYGYEGEFTNQLNRTIQSLRRFWNISSDEINVVPYKADFLTDVEFVTELYQHPFTFGLSQADAEFFAPILVATLEQSALLNGGRHPLFTFNAFAFSGFPGLGLPPKVVMGDAVMDAYDDAEFGLGDVAPQGILAHEWAHHVQFEKGYFDDPIPTFDPAGPNQAEATRYTELMADAMAAYFLTHKLGAALNQKRVEQFMEVFVQIGDCSFTSGSHHGTPSQRMAAAQLGFDLADQAQKQGHIMTAEEVHDVFVDAYLSLIAPDAP